MKCNHRFGIPKAQLCEHTHMEIETDKEIMISIYHWMQKLSCHQDKSEFVTPWNCNWKLSLLHKKSFMEIVVLLQELFWNFSRSKKSKIDLLRKTQSNHFWYEVQRSRDADFFPFWPTPQNNVEIGKVYFGTWTLVCHKFMTPTHTEESRAQKDGHGPQLKEV